MTVSDDLTLCWTEKVQREAAFSARAALEDCTNNIEQCHATIQGIVDSGNFTTLPTDLKQTLNQWWTIIKAARTAIGGNADIMSVFNWRP